MNQRILVTGSSGLIGLVIPHNFLNEINMTRENRP